MHEITLVESILEIALKAAEKEGAERVTRVFVEVGALSHVEPEALQFCWSAASAGTPAEGADLEIGRVPGLAWCMDCQRTVPVAERYSPCPVCGGCVLKVTSGDELKVREMEIA